MSNVTLNSEEVSVLAEQYRFTTEKSDDRKASISAHELLDITRCSSYLEGLEMVFQSPSHMVTASQFSKRYGFLITLPSLYAMTVFKKGLDLSTQNSHIESFNHNKVWLPKLRLNQMEVSEPKESYREWRDQIIAKIFAENLSRVWQRISEASKIPKVTLWENTALYVYWLYEKKIGKEMDPQNDFYYLIHDAPASLFGERENPLKKFYPHQSNSVRKTCCLYYQLTSPYEYCHSCPKGS